MTINYEDREDNIRIITLDGRLDIPGTDEIATKLAALSTNSQHPVILDLSAVSFLASIGIRALVSNAKVMQKQGGKLLLFVGNNEMVSKTLVVTGIDSLIPMFSDLESAINAT